MTALVRPSGDLLLLWCPACDDAHQISIAPPDGWSWDGNETSPTISPSILVTGVQWEPELSFHKPLHHIEPGERTVCHSFVRDGRWEFLADSTHSLAGQTVPMVELPDWLVN
jgi:hypothetical protein